MRPDPKLYTRIIRFERIGLHTNVAPLTIEVGVGDDGRGVYRASPDIDTQIERYARRFLDHDGDLNVHVHPDQHDGWIAERKLNGPDGDTLAEFTVHLPDEKAPTPRVDLVDVTAIAEVACGDPDRVVSAQLCRLGAALRIDANYLTTVRYVLKETGYTVRTIGGVLLVSLDQPDTTP